ncbi:MAG: 30S ribosomal protein S15 [gamma proteobacterium endosymbiont of Trioza apicalis]
MNSKLIIKIISDYGKSYKDTGSSAVQVAILTTKINYLQNHFLMHKKDFHSKRGLLLMVSLRKKLLNYLKKNDYNSYVTLISHYNLRH